MNFDLWVSKRAYEIFALVIKFLGRDYQPKHITIGLFEVMDDSGPTLAKDLIELLRKYNLREKIIAYVNNESSNLNTMTGVLEFVINCNILGFQGSFQGPHFGHAFSKTYRYVTKNEKGLKYISIKTTQFNLHEYITWL